MQKDVKTDDVVITTYENPYLSISLSPKKKDRLKPPLKHLDTCIPRPLLFIKDKNRFPMFDIWLKPVVTAIVVNDCLKHSRLLAPSIKYTDMVY